MHEEVGCGEVGERRGAAAAAGQGVGEVGGHDVEDADPHEEVEQLRGQPVDHFVQQVRGHGVVVTGERIDEAGGVRRALQLESGQPQPGGPPLGPLDEPADVHGVQIDPEPVEQGAGLVLAEGEVGRPDLGQHPGQAQPVQRPRRVPAGRDDEAKTRRGAGGPVAGSSRARPAG